MTDDEKFTADGAGYPRELLRIARGDLDDADKAALRGAALWIETAREIIAAADELAAKMAAKRAKRAEKGETP